MREKSDVTVPLADLSKKEGVRYHKATVNRDAESIKGFVAAKVA